MIACCLVLQVLYSAFALDGLNDNGRHEVSFVRAAVVYLPSDSGFDAADEFRWFHASWKTMVQHQPGTWRTDIIVVTDGDAKLPADLHCSKSPTRAHPHDPNQCFVLEQDPRKTQLPSFHLEFPIVHITEALTSRDMIATYDWLMLTNPNTLLAPAFATWKPTTFTVGGSPTPPTWNTTARLFSLLFNRDLDSSSDIATSLLRDYGPTWYGPADVIQSCGLLTVKLMELLQKRSFNESVWEYTNLPQLASLFTMDECTDGQVDTQPSMLDVSTAMITPLTQQAHLRPHGTFLVDLMNDDAAHDTSIVKSFALHMAYTALSAARPAITQGEDQANGGLRSTLVRAIVVAFPFDSYRTGQSELRWLHRSWQALSEPSSWRTDLIVVADTMSPLFDHLGCKPTPVRTTKREPNRCILVLNATATTPVVGGGADRLALHFLAGHPALEQYEWLLRTDVDTFVTPRFATWVPKRFTVGHAAEPYCVASSSTCTRLERVRESLGLPHPLRRHNFGSTWYGPARAMQSCAKRTVETMDHLASVEFTDHEKSPAFVSGRRGYPEWDFSLLGMYAGHIALQQCLGDDNDIDVRPDVLAVPTSSRRAIDTMVHLEAGMSFSGFNLFAFHTGSTKKPAFLNLSVASDFATDVALAANPDMTDMSFRHGLTEPFVRAAVIYLPSNGDAKFQTEFRWFHASWLDMLQHQPPRWRMDIVIFTDGVLPLWKELNCTTGLRQSPDDPDRCILVLGYEKVKSKEFDYGFADSINVVAIDHAATEPYDWILRSDIDTFFTPTFATWKPLRFTVGSVGGYCFDGLDTCDRLRGIARKLSLTDPTVDDVGSTWYGPTKTIHACGKLSMRVINHLHLHEFNETEKSPEYAVARVAGWPRWHYGVLTMYSGHIAIPHCTKDTGGFDKWNDMLDYPTFENTSVTAHAHTHARQSYNRFSKFRFKEGDYDDVDTTKLDRSIVSDHAMYMALQSKQLQADKQLQNGITESFVRAAVVYLASDGSGIGEFRWFHLSWLQMQNAQPPLWRTDLVVFTSTEHPFLKELGCTTTRRRSRDEPNQCIVVPDYVSIVSEGSFEFPLADTINIMASDTDDNVMDPYDWILRTDTETFLGPAFAKWKPETFTVGTSGGYCFAGEPTCGRLDQVGLKLKLNRTVGRTDDIGATWYGPAKIVRACAKLTVKLMLHLHTNEFTVEERSLEYYKWKVAGWPHWHYGVLHMYAGHMAIPHCTGGDYQKRDDMIDFSTLSKDAVSKHAHLRARQSTDEDFSSVKFRLQKYNDVNMTHLNPKTVKEFALLTAVAAQKLAELAPLNFDNGLNETFVRAAVVYLPSTGDTKFQQEMRWFHRSWRAMTPHQPLAWRTDIVIFTDGELSLWDDLDCTTQLRTSPDEPNRCILVKTYKKVRSKEFDYGFADSINVVAVEHAATEPYDWILRTDIDTFLTPAFATWKPLKFTVGSVGGYCFNGYNTCDRLKGIATKLNLTVSPVNDIGSTWYGPAKMIQACGKLSMQVINHLHLHEFNDTEKSKAYNKQIVGWPRWHYGVLTMYSGHLAIPHCTRETGFDKRDDLLDFQTFSDGPTARHPHLHTRQNAKRFSKFLFRNGSYDDVQLPDLNLGKVSNYAMYMALDSKRRPIIPKGLDDPFVRAVVLYLPSGDTNFESQFRWFHASWLEMVKHQPLKWRTDIVVFTTDRRSTPFLMGLGCTSQVRKTRTEANRCVVATSYKSARLVEFDTTFADSVNVLAVTHLATHDYDSLMGTTTETFLTPAFATWKPSKLTFGTAGYCFDGQPTCDRLKRVSLKMNLTAPTDVDVGATWYGPAALIQSCAKLSMDVMQYLHENEFTPEERSVAYGAAGWPRWHYGVLHLYANHIAMHHCTRDVGFDKRNDLIDFSTLSTDDILSHPHLRPPLSNEGDFSILKYRAGAYDKIDLASFKQNRVNGYASFMAVAANSNAVSLPRVTFANGVNETFVRAAVVYLPSDNASAKFLQEFRWFHLSWEKMILHQPPAWRTDLVVFTDGDVPPLAELGCTSSIRQTNDEASRCIVVNSYVKVLDQNASFGFAFADSINVASLNHAATRSYDWIVRTDLDTFFTPLFATWKPNQLTVGSAGSYCFETTCERLSGIAKTLRLADPSIVDDVGPTWYGPADLVRACAKRSMDIIAHLHAHEFNATEKSPEFYHLRHAGWPSWHYGALTHYAGHLAIHDCTAAAGGFDKRDDLLDYPTHAQDDVIRHAFLRTWPLATSDFSKSKFHRGTYGTINPDLLDATRVHHFALQVALQANEVPDASLTRGHDKPFVRAAVVYLTSTREPIDEDEFRWFHASWADMVAHQPPMWRMDLVVFVEEASLPLLDELGCTLAIRQGPQDANRCIVVPHYKSIDSAAFFSTHSNLFNVVALDHAATLPYDWLLRTDPDTIFTRVFATWKPLRLTVGRSGGYCFAGETTCDRLGRISLALNLTRANEMALGSTWYGPTSVVRECAQLTMRVMRHLHDHEFNATERSHDYYVLASAGWPHWHFGILHNYAIHIALQHCTRDVGFDSNPNMLDYASTTTERVSKHAHLQPTLARDKDFSKMTFREEGYSHVDVATLDRTTVQGHAMYQALRATRSVGSLLTNGLNASFVRAAVIYFPKTGAAKFQTEFRWFHRSWREMLPFQPPLWRMDIVVFSDGHVPLLDELGCRVGVRASPTDPNRCWIVPTYVKVHSDTFNYRFADSINVVAVDHIATEPYDWLLRCDIDTFFTPVFATWRPTKLTVGSVGGYCFDGYDTCDRLHSIGLKLNLTTSLVRDIGSTWYGPAKMIRECGKLSMDIINHLHENEFSADDKDGGVAGWPRWHYGVLTMYSGHLAIPHCTRETGFEKRNDMIDHTSYSKDKVARHAHVHAWQS
ncbi:hypothetical protein As57867_003192, partial [Aphanomyces stellatus]